MRDMDSLISEVRKALPEAELVEVGNEALEHYKLKFRARYGADPVILNIGIARTLMKDISRQVGATRLIMLISKYLSSDGDNSWYARQGHSLKTFQSKIEEINALLSSSEKKTVPSGYDPLVEFDSGCPTPNCTERVTIICKISRMGALAYSVPCSICSGNESGLSRTLLLEK